ncbi:MAG: PhzF family phenazine biosynthesis protein [Rhodocyclaceae bacterium]|nr:PhzF family phenazine biosynthesis protein [Rhodocyclaceae bacterium]
MRQFQVDAFTDRPFAGNPAAVCVLRRWLDDGLMQAIAAENNLSETAFCVREQGRWRLRWFTPSCEVPLCGHATLATAHVLFSELGVGEPELHFDTLGGSLSVRREADTLAMDFPAWPAQPITAPPGLDQALGATPESTLLAGEYLLVVVADAATVRRLAPDMTHLAALPQWGIVVTAPGDDGYDFVSRFFAPARGVPEDPVTGSAHCALTPYWATRSGRTRMIGLQCSARGGEVDCELLGERVMLRGRAVTVIASELRLDEAPREARHAGR